MCIVEVNTAIYFHGLCLIDKNVYTHHLQAQFHANKCTSVYPFCAKLFVQKTRIYSLSVNLRFNPHLGEPYFNLYVRSHG